MMLHNGYISNKLYKLKLWFQNPENKIWLIPFYGILFTIFLLFFTLYIDMNIKIPLLFEINKNTLDSLLSILSSSMLAVATFSIGVMVSAFSSVAGNITPRATLVVMNDKTAQNAISSFLAAFLYAVISQIALGQELYSKSGILIIFILTILVLIYLVFILIQWIGTLSKLGRLNDTVKKIEKLANNQLKEFWENPTSNLKTTSITEHRYQVHSPAIGYICKINLEGLNTYAKKHDIKIDIMAREGDFIVYGEVVCYVCSYVENKDEIFDYFIIEDSRNTDVSPDYNLTMLSEIGQRALSPAVNDPGTAIYILTIIARILNKNKNIEIVEQEIKYKNISIVPYDKNKFIKPIFTPITRDAKENIDVLVHLQKVLFSLNNNKDKELANLAKEYARISFENAQDTLRTKEEKQKLLEIHQLLFKAKIHG